MYFFNFYLNSFRDENSVEHRDQQSKGENKFVFWKISCKFSEKYKRLCHMNKIEDDFSHQRG